MLLTYCNEILRIPESTYHSYKGHDNTCINNSFRRKDQYCNCRAMLRIDLSKKKKKKDEDQYTKKVLDGD